MKIFALAVTTLTLSLSFCGPSLAQTADAPAKAPAPTKETAPAQKPKMDLDGFFKDAETQTRKAQESGNSNCVPKPKDETPKEPVT